MFARGGATRGPLHPLRGCPRAWALEWERWIRLRWLFGDSNTVVSSRWGLGGLRHFSGAFRPFRHSSRGLPSGSAIWCPSSLRCAEAHYSGFEGRASSKWLLGEYGIFLFCSQDFGLLGFFCARFPPREASNFKNPHFQFETFRVIPLFPNIPPSLHFPYPNELFLVYSPTFFVFCLSLS